MFNVRDEEGMIYSMEINFVSPTEEAEVVLEFQGIGVGASCASDAQGSDTTLYWNFLTQSLNVFLQEEGLVLIK